jgi:diguanylate cyclase (GGDEF)-like protein
MPGDDQKHRRLLLVDDDSVSRSVLSRQLAARGYDILEAESGGAALRHLTQLDAPRMAVVDWNMGTINGPELCRILRGRSPYVYVVLTTAREGRRPLVEAMNSGADGYIQKPVDVDELEAWLVAGQRIVELQDGLLKAHAELERRATHDALTGIRNRGSLMEILGRELRRSIRTKAATGIVLLDVDHFKTINDTHGHPVGDEVLIELAARCSRVVRDYDVVGRYGGEEFLVILPGGTLPDAASVGGRLLDAIGRRPFKLSSGELNVTASAGASSTGQGYLDVDALIAAADTALYEAKRAGRARLNVASEAGQPESARFSATEPDTLKGPD